jgi:trehalose 6-phosphate phosphatase
MKDILAPAQRGLLRDLADSRVLLAFDFDGTLAPIVRDPEAAAMRRRTARLLAQVAAAYPCVVISGRARADVKHKLGRLRLREVVGNHGMEPWPGLPAASRLAERWRKLIAARLPHLPGLVVEAKGPSLAIHYRQSRDRPAARRAILAAVADLPGARLVEGKMVVNLMPARAPTKGTAVLALARRLDCQAIIYIGDDDNDEDAFALAGHAHALGIRVGRSRRSLAGYFVRTQGALDDLLAVLGKLRQ